MKGGACMIRICIMEDNLAFCHLIEKALLSHSDFEIIGLFQNAKDAKTAALKLQPDIVLADLSLTPNTMDGLYAAKFIRQKTNAKIIILSSFEDHETLTQACKKTFASAYVFKSQIKNLADTIRKTYHYRTPEEMMIQTMIIQDLTHAEQTVLRMLLGEEIELRSCEKTIANQKTNILKKLGLQSVKELIHIFKP